jgi:hypothetical protein
MMATFPGPIDPARFGVFQDMAKVRIERCLATQDCTRPAIRAHSLQKSRFLKLLAEKGHVMAVRTNVKPDEGMTVDFTKVGIDNASTFSGLCSAHDDAIFAPIEKAPLELDSPHHLFLLAYRSILQELHEQMEAALRLQTMYLYRVENGLDPESVPSRAGLVATHRMVVAYETYRYKTELDEAYRCGDYGVLQHHVIELEVERPTVAASSYYSVDDVLVGSEMLALHLNVLPVSQTQTVAVFSYAQRFGRMARRHLRPMLREEDRGRAHDLSRLMIEGCGQLVAAPGFVGEWSPEKRAAIAAYFMKTAVEPLDRYDSPHFELFAISARDEQPANRTREHAD